MDRNATLRWILERDEVFRYQLLSRMKMDCEFFLGFGNRMEKYLWAGSVAFQIECMKSIWDSFPADGKPEWLTAGRGLYSAKCVDAVFKIHKQLVCSRV